MLARFKSALRELCRVCATIWGACVLGRDAAAPSTRSRGAALGRLGERLAHYAGGRIAPAPHSPARARRACAGARRRAKLRAGGHAGGPLELHLRACARRVRARRPRPPRRVGAPGRARPCLRRADGCSSARRRPPRRRRRRRGGTNRRAPAPPPPRRSASARCAPRNKAPRPRTRALCGEAPRAARRELSSSPRCAPWRVAGFIAGFAGFCEPSAAGTLRRRERRTRRRRRCVAPRTLRCRTPTKAPAFRRSSTARHL